MRHFLSIAEHSPEELQHLLDLAERLKKEHNGGGNKPLFLGKVLGMVFQKPSLRTRVSFDMAMRHLGGDALYISPAEIGIGQRESVADISRVLSGYVDAIMARVFAHDHVLEMAKYSRVPVINGLSDYNHPCQAMADALTLQEHFGGLAGRKIAYIGDGNNVATSLLHLCAKLGMHFNIASPESYSLEDSVIRQAQEFARSSGSRMAFYRRPEEAVADADAVYTDTWVSMGQEEQSEQRLAAFAGYQVNTRLLRMAKPDAVVLHCLPAHRGQEITDEVADGPQSLIFQESENRLHAQKAILVALLAPDFAGPATG
jgi:ornithine carbamoyltransferase